MPFEKVMAEVKKSLSRPYSRLSLALLVAVLCTVVTAIDIAPETGGPGVTCDEFYHVSYGKRLVASILANGLGFFRPHCICNTFDWRKDGPPVHPPLGDWILGWANWLFDPKPLDLLPTAIAPARLGTAVCFGCLAFIVGLFCIRQYGLLGGMSAAFSLICMPRLFGHAHLAALDLITALTCTSTIVAIIWAGGGQRTVPFSFSRCSLGLGTADTLSCPVVLSSHPLLYDLSFATEGSVAFDCLVGYGNSHLLSGLALVMARPRLDIFSNTWSAPPKGSTSTRFTWAEYGTTSPSRGTILGSCS
jgi:hypothetical protein